MFVVNLCVVWLMFFLLKWSLYVIEEKVNNYVSKDFYIV